VTELRRPSSTAIRFDDAEAAHREGRDDEARTLCLAILDEAPGEPRTHLLLAAIAHRQGDAAACLQALRRLLAQHPGHPVAWMDVGIWFAESGEPGRARSALERAAAIDPSDENAAYALAKVLYQLDEFVRAGRFYRRHAAAISDSAWAWQGLGSVAQWTGRFSESLAALYRAAAIDATAPEIHLNLALTHLLSGDYRQGWAAYEWRLELPGLADRRAPSVAPPWSGQALDGKTVLVRAEQGFGDTIQFARFVPLLAAFGGRVVFGVPTPLARLCRNLGVSTVEHGEALPPLDYEISLLSLPRVFETRPDSIPDQPYLDVDAELSATWRRRLGRRRRRRVGLAWAGSAEHAEDRWRSLPFDIVCRLLAVSSVRFFSLQVGPAREAMDARARRAGVLDLGGEVADFADTAAIMKNLDLVISCCSAPAHLAGALGVPVWVLVPFRPDWRWMTARDDSPWYPSARLFRQPRHGDWDSVIDRIAAELSAWAREN
jgi:Flp pilus assembly protein TadD